MWGVGAALGPYIMGLVLTGGQSWNMGYRYAAIFQVVLTAILFMSLPIWKRDLLNITGNSDGKLLRKPLSLRQIVAIPGAKAVMATFFCYCATEQTAGLWGSSYLVLHKGLSSEVAASVASLFFIGITAGRAISGFMTIKLNDTQMIRSGLVTLLIGIVTLLIPADENVSFLGLTLIGLGCAPIYPCLIHSPPTHFGADKSQAIIGVQMASAYVGTCLMPPLFGLIASHFHVALLPVFFAPSACTDGLDVRTAA